MTFCWAISWKLKELRAENWRVLGISPNPRWERIKLTRHDEMRWGELWEIGRISPGIVGGTVLIFPESRGKIRRYLLRKIGESYPGFPGENKQPTNNPGEFAQFSQSSHLISSCRVNLIRSHRGSGEFPKLFNLSPKLFNLTRLPSKSHQECLKSTGTPQFPWDSARPFV